eukprot:GFUD01010891.1.p1 GENE.GFUD01010891.1~~GFUD01010891.1.p1  ORF type:complete len:361 (+),score=104.28 GFUD01010891.1:33-1115(+)
MVIKVTNFPKFLREIQLYGSSSITQMEERIIEKFPADLEEFFEKNPEICDNNLDFTNTPHTPLKRDGVLFITQRRQATSDLRENPKVQLLGSHAALTCQIVLMRHTESRVASIGHFDNFSCWQFGDEASAHKEGLKVMMEEIEFLSKEDLEEGHIQVSVFGGYTDERGDAAKNSMSLLSALHDSDRLVEIVHFCVGPFNTCKDKEGKNTAILIGIAMDLRSQIIFPASFPWNNFEDFSQQLQDRVMRRTGQGKLLDDDDKHKTKLSTFKPKALRNPKTYKNLENSAAGKDKLSKTKEEEDNKKEYTTDAFGNKKFGNLKSFAESKNFQQTMSKEYQKISVKDNSKTLPPVNLKPVKNRSP